MALEATVENSLTAENIKDLLLSNFADRVDVKDDEIYQYLTMAQSKIARIKDWDDLKTTITISQTATGIFGDRIVPLDDSESTLNTVFNSTHRRLRNIHAIDCSPTALLTTGSERRFLTRIHTTKEWVGTVGLRIDATADTPTNYIWWKHDQLFVHPFPDANMTYEIFVSLFPTQIKEANKSAKFELIEAEDMIISLASSLIALRLKMERVSQAWMAMYQDGLRSFLDNSVDTNDHDVAAIRQDLGARSPAEFWRDPFSHSADGFHGEQVI